MPEPLDLEPIKARLEVMEPGFDMLNKQDVDDIAALVAEVERLRLVIAANRIARERDS